MASLLAGIRHPAVFSVCKGECLFLKLGVYVSVYVLYACMYLCACLCIYCVKVRGWHPLSFCGSPHFLRQSFTEPGDYELGCLASVPLGASCPPLLVLGLQCVVTMTFHMGAGDPNSAPHLAEQSRAGPCSYIYKGLLY